MTRVYLPTTLDGLRALADTGLLVPVEGVEGVVADGDDEESEYAALVQAGADSHDLLGGAAGRRVVVVADTPDPDAAVPLRHVVAVHADPDTRAADADPDDDLAWYATQEIDQLLL